MCTPRPWLADSAMGDMGVYSHAADEGALAAGSCDIIDCHFTGT
jgi:hypothetical protein